MAEKLTDKELDRSSQESSNLNHESEQKNQPESEQSTGDQSEQLLSARQEVTQAEQDSGGKEKDLLSKLEDLKKDDETDTDFKDRPVGTMLEGKAFQDGIRRIRENLSPVDRAGSHFIHLPFIRTISEVSSKSLTRPSGLLGGGLVALLGTSAYLYYTKHIGLKYNYSIFLFLLIGGFILGLVIEALVRLFRARKTS